MKIEIYGEPPRVPRLEVFVEGEYLEDAKKTVGGSPYGIAVVGHFATKLTCDELDGLLSMAVDTDGITVVDKRLSLPGEDGVYLTHRS